MPKITEKQVISLLTNLNVSLELAINAIEPFIETMLPMSREEADGMNENPEIERLVAKSEELAIKVKSLLS